MPVVPDTKSFRDIRAGRVADDATRNQSDRTGNQSARNRAADRITDTLLRAGHRRQKHHAGRDKTYRQYLFHFALLRNLGSSVASMHSPAISFQIIHKRLALETVTLDCGARG
jgi:hypothetical protein